MAADSFGKNQKDIGINLTHSFYIYSCETIAELQMNEVYSCFILVSWLHWQIYLNTISVC